jgi:hypothetical protein
MTTSLSDPAAPGLTAILAALTRRDRLQRAIAVLLLGGAAVLLAYAVALAFGVSSLPLLVAAGIVGTACAAALLFARAPDERGLARDIDRRHHTAEVLSTAVELDPAPGNVLARNLRRQADTLAATLAGTRTGSERLVWMSCAAVVLAGLLALGAGLVTGDTEQPPAPLPSAPPSAADIATLAELVGADAAGNADLAASAEALNRLSADIAREGFGATESGALAQRSTRRFPATGRWLRRALKAARRRPPFRARSRNGRRARTSSSAPAKPAHRAPMRAP